MDFRILGSLEVEDRGRNLPLGGHQQRALVALLLLRANDVVPVDEIIEHLWGAYLENPPEARERSRGRRSRSERGSFDPSPWLHPDGR